MPGFRRDCGHRGLAWCCGSRVTALRTARRRAPGVPARLPAPPPLGCSPPPGLDVLPPQAGVADPSPSAESRWGHQPARDSDGASEGQESGSTVPAPLHFRGSPGCPGPSGRADGYAGAAPPQRQRVRSSAGPGPPTGAPKRSGTRKLQRELFPKKGLFILSFRPQATVCRHITPITVTTCEPGSNIYLFR